MGVIRYERYSDAGKELYLTLLPSVEVGDCLRAGIRRAQTTYAHPTQPVRESSCIYGCLLASTIHFPHRESSAPFVCDWPDMRRAYSKPCQALTKGGFLHLVSSLADREFTEHNCGAEFLESKLLIDCDFLETNLDKFRQLSAPGEQVDGGINRFCPKLAYLNHRVNGESPEAFGGMAEHFCRTLRSLAEGLDSAAKCF